MTALSARQTRLMEAIARRADTLLDDLRLHVGLPTGGRNLDAIDETRSRLADRLAVLGASVGSVPGEPAPAWLWGQNVGGPIPPTTVCSRLKPGAGPGILLAGHMDTVHDPRGPFRELSNAPDGMTATGPGCVDMKGGLVILIAALEALEEVGIDASWTVLLNADEETGTFHSASTIREQAGLHDIGIAVEPALAGGELAVERMGAGQFAVEVHGRSAHVGRSFIEGVSAVNGLAQALLSVAKMPEPERGKILSVGPVRGGSAVNAVPDEAWAWGNVRYRDMAIGRQIEGELAALERRGDLPTVRVHRVLNRPAKPLTPEVEAFARYVRARAEMLGQKLPFASTGGVCDGNIMQDAGLPTLDTLGVRGGGLHTPGEWIELASLVERCQLLAFVIEGLGRTGLPWGGQ